MKVTLVLLKGPTHVEQAFTFEDFKQWPSEMRRKWVKEHPDSKFAKFLGVRTETQEREPQKPLATKPSPKPEIKTKQDLMKERMAKHLENTKLRPHKERQHRLRSLHKTNKQVASLRTKLKDFAWGGNSKKIGPRTAAYVASRTKKAADRLEQQNMWVHTQLLKHMARELKKAGIDPRKLKPGSMKAGTIAYVGRDPKVAKVWDAAKARLKETPDFKMWHEANAHLKSLRKTHDRYSKIAGKGQDNEDRG